MIFRNLRKGKPQLGFTAATQVGDLRVELISPETGMRLSIDLCGAVVAIDMSPGQWREFVQRAHRVLP